MMSTLWSHEIYKLIESGKTVTHSYEPSESVIKILSNGAIYIKADMDADADGSPRAHTIDPRNGRPDTSLRKPRWSGNSEYVNSETIPYFVLPLNFTSVCGMAVRVNELLGDLALIRWRDREVFAIFADEGPKHLIGEGSIKAIEEIGGNPWNAEKSLIVKGLPFGVEYLIFPHAMAMQPIPATHEDIQKAGLEVFQKLFSPLKDRQISMTPEEMQQKSGAGDIEVWEIMNAPEFVTLTDLNCRSGVGTDREILTVIPAHTPIQNKARYNPNEVQVLNVGADKKGLWVLVEYNHIQGFVRASMKYLIPLSGNVS